MSSDNRFNIELVVDHFKQCLCEEDDVKVLDYVKAYEELSRLFNELGVIFSFVETDVSAKRTILKELHSQDPAVYGTVQSMVRHECGEGENGTPKEKGARTLLRLHRALAFVISFVRQVYASEADGSVSAIFRDSYQSTLAPHHTWLIRKTVGVAAGMVPSRPRLLEVIFAVSQDDATVASTAQEFLQVTEVVYERVQHIYASRELLNLP